MNPGGSRKGGGRSRLATPLRFAVAVALLGGLFACVSQWAPQTEVLHHRTEPVAGAGAEVGSWPCYACHDSFEEHFVATDGHLACEACHGAAMRHVFTARPMDIRYPANEDCAGCHQIGSKSLLGWTTSEHARSGVLCSDCHNTHNRALWHVRESVEVHGAVLRSAGGVTRMCVSCHPEVSAQFDLPSHHPIGEGMLECTDCHGAHENRRETLGAATRVCVECHQETAGPWIYEHAPVTEDCGYCHAPHGASADFLLQASQPAACISCHTLPIAGAVHQPYAFTTRCTDCHSAVHGSYTDPHLRR